MPSLDAVMLRPFMTLLALIGVTTHVATSAETRTIQAKPCDRLYVFGDSYSDTGFGYVDGNGPTAVAYAAHDLGLTLLPAGVGKSPASRNYAVSGATTGRGAGAPVGRSLLGFGMIDQVETFTADAAARRLSFEPARTVFFLAGGLNDGPLALSRSLANIEEQVRLLHDAGARRFVVARIPAGIINREVGAHLNPALPGLLARLASSHPDSMFDLSRWGDMFDRVHAEARRRGFVNDTSACSGRVIFEQDATPCAEPSTFFFYHDGHPSTEAHRQVGALLADEARRGWCPRPS